jgi:hypothetical protein
MPPQPFPTNATRLSPELQDVIDKDPSLYLGINCCLVCGLAEEKTTKANGLQCPQCEGVWYCSKACFNEDKGVDYNEEDFDDLEEDEEDSMSLMSKGLGHTPIVCMCIKEALEDEEEEGEGSEDTR